MVIKFNLSPGAKIHEDWCKNAHATRRKCGDLRLEISKKKVKVLCDYGPIQITTLTRSCFGYPNWILVWISKLGPSLETLILSNLNPNWILVWTSKLDFSLGIAAI